jgi:hypothetical protein
VIATVAVRSVVVAAGFGVLTVRVAFAPETDEAAVEKLQL